MYSGYFSVTPSDSRQLHYVFVESKRDPATDPLIVWLPGGPGGNNMLELFAGFGPYLQDRNGTISVSPHSLTRQANILYIECPAGTGYSYGKRIIDEASNDQQSSLDSLNVLNQFFSFWPHLRQNPIYTAGHSYGGVHAAHLAWQIHQHNQAKPAEQYKLKGVIVANTLISHVQDSFLQHSIENLAHYNLIPFREWEM